MEIKNKAQLLEFIRQQSLKLLKEENQAFASLEDKLEVADANYIEVYEKKLVHDRNVNAPKVVSRSGNV